MNRRQRLMYGNNSYSSNPFAEAPFIAELRKSLVLNRGTGSPTFTRATTATFTDFEGVLRTAIAGEARFVGARRVRNLCAKPTENLSTGGWANSNITVTTGVTDPLGGTTAFTLTAAAINGFIHDGAKTTSGTQITNVWVRRRTGTGQVLMYDGSATFGQYAIHGLLTNSWQQITTPAIAGGSNSAIGWNLVTLGDAIDVWHPQQEDVTGQSVQTAGEYVSVGVLSAPYHGAGVDGVKYFSTFLNNTPISSSTAKYASLPGVAGSYFSTPDSAANSITGDIDIRVKVALANWTPTAANYLVAKYNETGNQQSFVLQVDATTGLLRLFTSADGSTNLQNASTVAPTVTNGTTLWVRATLQVNDGSGNRVAKFYTSSDGVTWTQLGATVTTAGATSIFDSTSPVEIGSGRNGALGPANGRIYQAQIYNGINGTLAVNFNANDYQTGGTWTASQTGEWWYVNGGATVFGGVGGSWTNVATQSQTLNTWTKTNTSVSADAIASPDGTLTADKVIEAVGAGTHDIEQGYTTTAIPYTLSVFAKAGERSIVYLSFYNSAVTQCFAFFNLSAGTVASVSGAGASGKITAYQNGWYRCELTVSSTYVGAGNSAGLGITTTAGTQSYTGDGTSGAYFWGAMMEATSSASPYIPTTSAAVTITAPQSPFDATGPKGYFSEGSRQNICLQSNAFTTTWTNTIAAPTQNAIGPDGATSAWTLTDSSAVALASINQGITLTAATYTLSIFVKKTSGAQSSYPILSAQVAVGSSAMAQVTIDTSNGVATPWTAYAGWTGVSCTATCTSYNANYWLVSATFTGTAALWNIYLIPAGTTNATQSTGTYDVTAQGSAVFYGAQVELGSFASTYIQTTTVAVTRNADVLTYPSSGNYADAAGWAYLEVSSEWNDTATGRIALSVNASTIAPVTFYNIAPTGVGYYDGTNANSKTGLTSINSGVRKRASTWGSSTVLVAGDGATPANGSYDGSFNPGASIAIGSDTSGSNNFYGTIRNVRIGQAALSAAQIQAITT